MSYSTNQPQQHDLLDEIMEDLAVRFIFSCPEEEYQELDRLMFQFELAHWFYLDEYYDKNPRHLPKLSFKNFCSEMFDRFPPLQRYSHHVQEHIKSFQKYKNQVPVCGCLLLNEKMTKVLMVQAFGARSWNFPKGKINKGESQLDCAVRESHEEIGFVPPQEHLDEMRFIETASGGKKIKLFIVPHVDEHTHFATQTKQEIAKIQWQSLSKMSPNEQKYRYVWPVIRRLKQWIRQNKKKQSPRSSPQPAQSTQPAQQQGGNQQRSHHHVNTGSDSQQQKQHHQQESDSHAHSTTSHQKSHNNRRQKNHRGGRAGDQATSSSDESSHSSNAGQQQSARGGGNRRRRSRNSDGGASKKDSPQQKKHAKPNKKQRSSSHPAPLHTISAPIDVKKFAVSGFPSANSAVSTSASPSFHNFSFDTNEMLRAIHG